MKKFKVWGIFSFMLFTSITIFGQITLPTSSSSFYTYVEDFPDITHEPNSVVSVKVEWVGATENISSYIITTVDGIKDGVTIYQRQTINPIWWLPVQTNIYVEYSEEIHTVSYYGMPNRQLDGRIP
jgi:hypothetical protein